MLMARILGFMFRVGVMVLVAGMAVGQDYPNKTVRIITGAAGGGSDFTARVAAQGITGPLGQPVVVENRTVLLATEAVAKAPSDGYTLVVNGNSLWILPMLQKTGYEATRDFSPISQLVREFTVLAVHPSLPVKSVKDLIALAKARKGELNYGIGAMGALSHLGMELFKSMAGVDIVVVPYKGGTAQTLALLSGEVQVVIADANWVVPQAKAGKIRALAVTSGQQTALVSGLPTVSESGLPGFEATSTTGIWAPAKTSEAIIKRLSQELIRVFNQQDVKEKYANAGIETVGNSSEQFAAFIRADTARWTKVIKESGIKLD
jgi:tripartite-type tricarboxylate transporter receptor subunit TctC